MASQDTITIVSEEEDDEIQFIFSTPRRRRKRRRLLHSIPRHVDLEGDGPSQNEVPPPVLESPHGNTSIERAKSADVPPDKSSVEPAAVRARSAPHGATNRANIPASFPHTQVAMSSASCDSKPFTPARRSSCHIEDPTSSATKRAYPTPVSAASSVRPHQSVDFFSSGSADPGTTATSATPVRKSLPLDRPTPQGSPQIIRAAERGPRTFYRSTSFEVCVFPARERLSGLMIRRD